MEVKRRFKCTKRKVFREDLKEVTEEGQGRKRGDRLAQWLERWTGDPKVEGSNLARITRKT